MCHKSVYPSFVLICLETILSSSTRRSTESGTSCSTRSDDDSGGGSSHNEGRLRFAPYGNPRSYNFVRRMVLYHNAFQTMSEDDTKRIPELCQEFSAQSRQEAHDIAIRLQDQVQREQSWEDVMHWINSNPFHCGSGNDGAHNHDDSDDGGDNDVEPINLCYGAKATVTGDSFPIIHLGNDETAGTSASLLCCAVPSSSTKRSDSFDESNLLPEQSHRLLSKFEQVLIPAIDTGAEHLDQLYDIMAKSLNAW